MAKTLTVAGATYTADKITKTAKDIIGYDGNTETFAFRGVVNFGAFSRSGGAYDELIQAGDIRVGTCTLNSASNVAVTFSSPLAGVPRIVLTANSTTSGVLCAKTRNVTASGFDSILGGSVKVIYGSDPL